MKRILFLLAFLLPITFGFSMPQATSSTTCPDPANVTVSSKTSDSISFDWDDCGCAFTEYRVYYESGSYTSPEYATSSSDYAFTGLSEGEYTFYFFTVCGSQVSGFIIIDDSIEH